MTAYQHDGNAKLQEQEQYIFPLNVKRELAEPCEECLLPCQKVDFVI